MRAGKKQNLSVPEVIYYVKLQDQNITTSTFFLHYSNFFKSLLKINPQQYIKTVVWVPMGKTVTDKMDI